MPSQAGQAPAGLLKEKRRGVISGKVVPQVGQANFSENRMSSPSSGEILTSPPVSLAASSTESVSRWRMPSFCTRRSMNTSMVWDCSGSSLGGSLSSASSPSMLART